MVGFHTGLVLTSPQDARNIVGRISVLNGADDPVVSPEQRTEFEKVMREGQVDWQMTLFGGVVHSFTDHGADRIGDPQVARYDERADKRSWQQMANLFHEAFA